MEVIGKIIAILPKVTGSNLKGTWEKQDMIIETLEQYSKTICLANWGEKVNFSNLNIGTKVKAMINLESREYSDKWYTDVKVWKIDVLENAPTEPHRMLDKSQTIENDTLPLNDLPF